jgi:hypothetical protein
MGWESVVPAMTGQERDTAPPNIRDRDRVGWVTVRGRYGVLLCPFEQRVKPGTADYAEFSKCCHPQTLTVGLAASYGALHGVDRVDRDD